MFTSSLEGASDRYVKLPTGAPAPGLPGVLLVSMSEPLFRMILDIEVRDLDRFLALAAHAQQSAAPRCRRPLTRRMSSGAPSVKVESS